METELTQVVTPKLGLDTGVWGWAQSIDIGSIGYLMVILFVIFYYMESIKARKA